MWRKEMPWLYHHGGGWKLWRPEGSTKSRCFNKRQPWTNINIESVLISVHCNFPPINFALRQVVNVTTSQHTQDSNGMGFDKHRPSLHHDWRPSSSGRARSTPSHVHTVCTRCLTTEVYILFGFLLGISWRTGRIWAWRHHQGKKCSLSYTPSKF